MDKTPTCYVLKGQRSHKFNGGRGYYKGDVVSCDYHVVDHKNRKRRVIVSLADVAGTKVAVQVRAKIPILPDAVFRLRTPKNSTPVEQVAAVLF